MKAKVFTLDGSTTGEVDLPAEVFGADVNESLMHEVVVSYLGNRRQGTAKAKGRSEVSGGGRKPFRQKGTGRARAGSNASPLWVRGGKAFGPVPRDYERTIPKKKRRAALRSALSSRAQSERIVVVEGLALSEPKTKIVASFFKGLPEDVKGRTLLIIESDNKNVYLSSRNLRDVEVKSVTDINTYDVLNSETIMFGAKGLVDKLKEVFAS